jgi:hypothetical protein
MFIRSALVAAAASMFAVAAFADPVSAPVTPMPQPDASQSAPDSSGPPMTDMSAPARQDAMAPVGSSTDASATVDANGVIMHSAAPIPDTPANRAAFGQPLSRTGKRTPPIGN